MATNSASADGPIKISRRIEKELHQTKVVVRRLPPDLTEEKLMEIFPDLPPYTYFYFVGGDPSLGGLSFSRAYISFTDEASIMPFRDKYDGMFLESEKGSKYRVVVEFAPYQGVPKRQKRKPDARIGTIEQDADYKAFLETADEKPAPPSMNELLAYAETLGTSKVVEVQKTPLISYLLESRRGGRSSKRSKPSSDSKKKYAKESSKSSRDSRRDAESSKSSSKESRSKAESREGKERSDRGKKDVPGSSSKERLASSEKRKDRAAKEKRSQPQYEENGEVRGEGSSRDSQVKNKDRPDQAIYSPRGKQRNHDRERNDYRESTGRSKDRDRPSSSSKDSTSDYRSSRDYNYDEKPRRSKGGGSWDDYSSSSKDRRDREKGRRGDGYRKVKDSYSDHDKSRSGGYREK